MTVSQDLTSLLLAAYAHTYYSRRIYYLFVTPISMNVDDKYKVMVDDQINLQEQFIPLVDINVMQDCVNDLKTNKAPGFDGISSEHKYAGAQLLVHLCLLFNAICVCRFLFWYNCTSVKGQTW